MISIEILKQALDVLLVVFLYTRSRHLKTNQERFEFIPDALVTIAMLLL